MISFDRNSRLDILDGNSSCFALEIKILCCQIFFLIDANLFFDVAVFSVVEPYQAVSTHAADIARHFLARMKLKCPLTGVAGGTPCAQFILQRLTAHPHHGRDP